MRRAAPRIPGLACQDALLGGSDHPGVFSVMRFHRATHQFCAGLLDLLPRNRVAYQIGHIVNGEPKIGRKCAYADVLPARRGAYVLALFLDNK